MAVGWEIATSRSMCMSTSKPPKLNITVVNNLLLNHKRFCLWPLVLLLVFSIFCYHYFLTHQLALVLVIIIFTPRVRVRPSVSITNSCHFRVDRLENIILQIRITRSAWRILFRKTWTAWPNFFIFFLSCYSQKKSLIPLSESFCIAMSF